MNVFIKGEIITSRQLHAKCNVVAVFQPILWELTRNLAQDIENGGGHKHNLDQGGPLF